MGERIPRAQIDESAVDLQAVGESALEREVVAMHAEHIDEVGIAAQNRAEEIELEIELALRFESARIGVLVREVDPPLPPERFPWLDIC